MTKAWIKKESIAISEKDKNIKKEQVKKNCENVPLKKFDLP
jgi:hypothetical protein